ncbi:MAG: BLUF domain-containing protein [Acetobacteraceae bacterium]|nr:MAG: BLUF domain-containing protein [Acetobacteraceae bacterium]
MSSEPLYRLAYLSQNLLPPEESEAGIRQILETARRKNTALGLTGALLFSADAFAQVLEGPESVVWETYHRIEADPRHSNPMVVGSGPIAARSFGAWSMGYIGPSPEVEARFAAITAKDNGAQAGPEVVDLLLATMAGQTAEAAAA